MKVTLCLCLLLVVISSQVLTIEQKKDITNLFNGIRYEITQGNCTNVTKGFLQAVYWDTDLEASSVGQVAVSVATAGAANANPATVLENVIRPKLVPTIVTNGDSTGKLAVLVIHRSTTGFACKRSTLGSITCYFYSSYLNKPLYKSATNNTGVISFDLTTRSAPLDIFGSGVFPNCPNSYKATYDAATEQADLLNHSSTAAPATINENQTAFITAITLNPNVTLPTQSQRDAYLAAHNKARKQVRQGFAQRLDGSVWPKAVERLPNVQWDQYAEAMASNWTQYIGSNGLFDHNPNNTLFNLSYGENIAYAAISGSHYNVSAAFVQHVQMYFDEGRCHTSISLDSKSAFVFNSQDTTCSPHVGHFSQVVWANTLYVGCGYFQTLSSGFYRTYTACNYSPPGNYPGQAIYR